jgi:O-antigen/teichoic acid export membrane protein
MGLGLKGELKQLGKHSLVYGLGNLLQQLGALLMLPIYTQFLTTHEYGIKELVGLSSDVVAILLATAISGAFYRFYFKYEDEKDRNEVVSTSLLSIGAIGLAAVVLLALGTRVFADVILDDASLYHYFLVAFTSLWFQTINSIGYNYLKANKQSGKFILLSLAKMLVAIGLNVWFVAILKIGVIGILISTLITSILMSLILTFPLIIKVGYRVSLPKLKEIVKFGLPLIPAQFGSFIVHLSDRYFIKEYASIADAGIYSLGYRFGALPSNFISGPFNQIFLPRRLEVYKEKDSAYIFGKIFTYYLMIMGYVGLMVAVLSKDVIIFMSSEEFWPAHEIVPLIVLATTIFTFHYHLDIGIVISKQTKYAAYVNLSNAVVVLFLNYMLIPNYGIFGAIWATLISFIYNVVLTYYYSSKFYKTHFELIRVGKLLIVTFLIYSIAQTFQIETLFLSFISKFLFVLFSYPAFLYLFKLFSSEEIRAIAHRIKNLT